MTPIHPGVGASSVAAAVTGWFSSKSGAVTTGGQLDELLAGPDRPPAPTLPEPLGQRMSYRPPEQTVDRSGAPVTIGGRKPVPYSKAAAGVEASEAARNQAYLNLDLAKQRGEMMNSLEEGLSNLERGAKNFSKDLKSMAIKSVAKDKLRSYF